MPSSGDGENNNRTVTGPSAQNLPDPGTDAQTSTVVSPGLPGDPAAPSPPAVVDNTPTASGDTPRRTRTAAQLEAEDAIRDSSSTADSEVARVGQAPHYFAEQIHQAFYHEAIVYIEGEDVSPFLVGSISVSYGFGNDPNSCELSLDNAGHRFTITPENLKGEFRRTSPVEQFGPIDYDETVKSNMYARKGSSAINPVDPDSGGRRFPLHLWGSIFHKYDSIRVWIHNPASENDEWIPVFTGFIVSKPTTEDYIKGLSVVKVSCKDIRHLMQRMRVNKNTMLTTYQTTGAGADPTNQNSISNLNMFHTRDSRTSTAQFSDSSNRSFSEGFFSDVVRGSNFENPWTSLTLPNLIATLTFLPERASQSLLSSRDTAVQHENSTQDRRVLVAAARELQPLQAKVEANGLDSLSDTERERYNTTSSVLTQASASTGDIAKIINGTFRPHDQSEDNAADTANATTEASATTGSTTGRTTNIADRSEGMSHGSGRIGRMRPGVFPWRGSLFGDPPRPYYREHRFPQSSTTSSHNTGYYAAVAEHMEKWYNLCFFSTPLRHDSSLLSLEYVPFSSTPTQTGVSVSDSAPDYSAENRRYWTESEVRAAGMRITREGAWHPSAQAVHFLSPGTSTPAEMLWDQKVISSTPTSQNPNWSNRLAILSEACKTADYRFWVSGAGDLIFEFAQYDFSPKDYGAWENVLTLDHHLKNESLDDEGGEIKTGMSVTGSITQHASIDESGITTLHPITTVGVWSPNLASRLGIDIAVRSYPQINDPNRLEQIATLEFQKALAVADKYSISLAFRPWVILNRPIFNSYRARYALVDGVRWTYPVTAGEMAGHTAPTMQLSLNYTRSLDEVGVPRYITGGPSNAMYFARPANSSASRNYLTSTTARLRTFASALHTISTTGELTQQQRDVLRDRYRAVFPAGQNVYNVVSSLLLTSGTQPPGEEDPRITALRSIEADIEELTQHPGAFTEQETLARLQDLESRSSALARSLEEDEPTGSYSDQTSAGTMPVFGRSGIRSTLRRGSRPSQTSVQSSSSDTTNPCNLGPEDLFSSPLGPAQENVFRGRSRTSLSGRFADTEPSGVPTSASVAEFKEGFPRYAIGVYDLRVEGSIQQWHRGVDIQTVPGADVFSVANGVVIHIKSQFAPVPSRGQFSGQRGLDPQMAIYIIHRYGYVTVYRHLDPSSILVSPGEVVGRNQPIGKVGLSGAERMFKPTHLHFETCAVFGSDVFEKYVSTAITDDPSKRFRLVRQSEIRALGASSRTAVEALTVGTSTGGSTITARDRGSLRVMYNAGFTVGALRDESASGLDLDFLRASDGTYRVRSTQLLTWSPLPSKFPFSRADSPSRPYGPRGSDKELMSLSEYRDRFSLKGIPGLNIVAQSGSQEPVPVPEISTSGSSSATRAAERRRARAIRTNERIQQHQQAHQEDLDQQKALFSDAVPPNDCPPGSFTNSELADDLSEPPILEISLKAFWGKSLYIRGRNFYTEGDYITPSKSSGFSTLYLSPAVGHSREDADNVLREGLKVGWWVGQSEMVPGTYVEAINRRVAIANPKEPFVINWERAPEWSEESDRLALYDFLLDLAKTYPVGISTLDRYRYRNEAATHLSGKVVYMPEQYSLGTGHTTGDPATDAANRATSRAALADKWGGPSLVIPTVAGYRRDDAEMFLDYLKTFSSLKGSLVWDTRFTRTKARSYSLWPIAGEPI